MAATALTVQTITENGITPATAVNGDATSGNSFANTGVQWVVWTNTGASSGTWSIAFPNKVKGQTVPAKSFTVAAGATHWAGPFDPSVYGSIVTMTPSASTMQPAVYQWSK